MSKRDYPWYDKQSSPLGGLDWLIILVALAAGFAVLALAPPTLAGVPPSLYGLLRAILFSVIPLAALAWRAGTCWRALFNGWKASYLWWGLLFGVINLAFTAVIGSVAIRVLDLAANPVVGDLAGGEIPGGPAMFYLTTGLQLFGEEVITLLPFLFLLWLGVQHLSLSRTAAVIIAWVGSAVLFGAIHLPTYDWNVVQALLLIGPVRLVLTLAYMVTKSIWASTIAHILNDWTMFTFAMVMGGMAAAGGG
ncbi:CPBP family intramembrane metalloprotease [Marinihelvus fidelis]|uniref:CPBP family intramembrane metalloprotease n=1 Tax=Marinihelvus fidelis TaxID=2613842 RepID=A0A5N0T4E6_9GAMM|nr:CPBP family intramembrane glutamic endopeptidase [Marinihelvus fidelis]KAA9129731.1 CPBP family intramembrane metalloprotease [Marinihelvus fidelis]